MHVWLCADQSVQRRQGLHLVPRRQGGQRGQQNMWTKASCGPIHPIIVIITTNTRNTPSLMHHCVEWREKRRRPLHNLSHFLCFFCVFFCVFFVFVVLCVCVCVLLVICFVFVFFFFFCFCVLLCFVVFCCYLFLFLFLWNRNIIGSLSLGQTRRFILKHKEDKAAKKIEYRLPSGSLVLMMGTTQQFWQHSVPKGLTMTTKHKNKTQNTKTQKQNTKTQKTKFKVGRAVQIHLLF